MKSKILLLFVAVLAIVGCKKDDEKKLEGRWNLSKMYHLMLVGGVKQSEETESFKVGEHYVVFEGNNISFYSDGKLEDKGTFVLAENSLTLTGSDGDKEVATLRWNSKDEFAITADESGTEQGVSYSVKLEQTYQRHR